MDAPPNKALDTIVAQATPAGRGGISVVRVSGPQVQAIAQAVLGSLPSPRVATKADFCQADGEIIDHGLALFFPAPNSFTGEHVLEFQGHGGPVVVDLLIKAILSLGARLARPGEFSERAFLNSKIDLLQAEAIADLIQASTEQAARSALRSLQGEFSAQIRKLVESLIQLRIYIEAAIDFAEEEIDFLADANLQKQAAELLSAIEEIEGKAKQGSLLREGLTVVIAGKPNVGKSTLLNLLSGKDSAIVTDIPGTTRDLLREQIQLDGIPLHLVDTAGLRETEDKIEHEGIRRAKKEIKQADLVLQLIDDFSYPSFKPEVPTLIIRNKIDLTEENPSFIEKDGMKIVSISARENQGLDLLKEAIKACIGIAQQNEGIFSARQRHLDALARAKGFLSSAVQQLQTKRQGELIAEDLRQTQQALNEITGEFNSDDLLGRIFSNFCIGK